MKLKVLGPLEIVLDDRISTPTGPKLRQVLALLTMRSNQVVNRDAIIEELWNDRPPKTARTTVQTYVYHLRKWFGQFDGGRYGEEMLFTRAPGYTFVLPEGALDADRFTGQLDRGRALFDRGDAARAAVALRSALDLWSGPALDNVPCGSLLQPHVTNLEERRIIALELLVAAEMRLGRHRELIAELRSLVTAHPLNESFHTQLIVALSKSQRRGEALRAYHDLRFTLQEELGLDPSADVQRIHQAVLTSDELVLESL